MDPVNPWDAVTGIDLRDVYGVPLWPCDEQSPAYLGHAKMHPRWTISSGEGGIRRDLCCQPAGHLGKHTWPDYRRAPDG